MTAPARCPAASAGEGLQMLGNTRALLWYVTTPKVHQNTAEGLRNAELTKGFFSMNRCGLQASN